MALILWTALFFPLASFLFILLTSPSRKAVIWLGPSACLVPFFCFLFLFSTHVQPFETTLFNWIHTQAIKVDFTLHLDQLSLLMGMIITGVGFLIHVYSVGYMDHEPDICRFFAVMNFFIFSMLLLVLAADLVVLFIGWEGVGLASYLLIGFWFDRPADEKAAKKAFIVNRIGDLGLLLGLLLTFSLYGTCHIQEVCAKAGPTMYMTLLTVLIFWAATAKSAQIPLHVWLPDAMEGPTPVSALIHAATMVTAGVYLVVRLHPLFTLAPWTLELVGYVGAATSLFAALCATSQKDLKRVLAYSTISQLGLMFAACGVSANLAAMFHLTTHAFVKALLFLAAGNVIHMMHGITLMEKMGGLAKIFSTTNILFLIGVLAMAGIPPLAIFFSKDMILEELTRNKVCYLLAASTSLLTAFYLMRAYLLVFQGPCHDTTFKEAPKVMLIPVSILAFLSTIAGFFLPFHFTPSVWVSLTVALVGVGTAFVFNQTWSWFFHAFYIDTLYNWIVVQPMHFIAKSVAKIVEPKVFETSMRRVAEISYKTADLMQEAQNGQIRSYIAWMVTGAAFLIIYVVFEGV